MSSPVYHGVDFSGSRNAARNIWVGAWDGRAPAVTSNEFSYAQLVDRIASSADDGRRHVWLIDAPFGLARSLLEAHGVTPTWPATIEWLRAFASPREWRRACRKVSRKEPKRDVDTRASTPFAPTNLRLFKQTWACIVQVLAPLAEREGVAVLPFHTPARADMSHVWVGEGCPSSALRDRDWPRTGYKGREAANRHHRAELADLLVRSGVPIEETSLRRAIGDHEGDALDSLLLLPSSVRFADHDPRAIIQDDPNAMLEGWVYV